MGCYAMINSIVSEHRALVIDWPIGTPIMYVEKGKMHAGAKGELVQAVESDHRNSSMIKVKLNHIGPSKIELGYLKNLKTGKVGKAPKRTSHSTSKPTKVSHNRKKCRNCQRPIPAGQRSCGCGTPTAAPVYPVHLPPVHHTQKPPSGHHGSSGGKKPSGSHGGSRSKKCKRCENVHKRTVCEYRVGDIVELISKNANDDLSAKNIKRRYGIDLKSVGKKIKRDLSGSSIYSREGKITKQEGNKYTIKIQFGREKNGIVHKEFEQLDVKYIRHLCKRNGKKYNR